jgi:hypothetical protein
MYRGEVKSGYSRSRRDVLMTAFMDDQNSKRDDSDRVTHILYCVYQLSCERWRDYRLAFFSVKVFELPKRFLEWIIDQGLRRCVEAQQTSRY